MSRGAALIFFLSPLLAAGGNHAWQVFLDDHAILSRAGVHAVLHSPERLGGNPIVWGEFRWETKGVTSPSVVFDPATGWLHMYYAAMESAPGKDDQGGIRRLAYARSKDGIHWERPPLGLVDLPGVGSKNNLLITSRAGPTGSNNGRVDLDLHPPSPDRRFVMIYEDDLGNDRWSKFSAASEDGIHWKTLVELGDLRKSARTTPPTSSPRYVFVLQNWVKDANVRRTRGIYRRRCRL